MNLDDINRIRKFDTNRVADSIEALPKQIKQVLSDFKSIEIPPEYKRVNQVVVNGMGGSNIGVGILKSAFSQELKVPVSITPGYEVPAHVNKKTLYVFSSYSGSTEEPLSVYEEVKRRGAKMIGIVSAGGSKLEQLMKKDNLPGYIFKPMHNPSGQPRLGIGYSIFGISMLLSRAGLFKINETEIKEVIAALEQRNGELAPGSPSVKNRAKQIAAKIFGKQPVLVAAEFLIGNARAMRNHFCENSKNFASYLTLPELNHYALEGLANPRNLGKNLVFIFFTSELYHPRVQKRAILTKEIVVKDGIEAIEYQLTGRTRLDQAFELLQLGSWITFYLAILNQTNPAEIKWVDWFKKKLEE